MCWYDMAALRQEVESWIRPQECTPGDVTGPPAAMAVCRPPARVPYLNPASAMRGSSFVGGISNFARSVSEAAPAACCQSLRNSSQIRGS